MYMITLPKDGIPGDSLNVSLSPVYNFLLMTILNRGDNLPKLCSRLLFLHSPVENKVVEYLNMEV